MKLVVVFIASFLAAQLASFFIFFKQATMYLDKNYVTSLQLSPEADSLGIPIFGAIILGLFSAFCICAVYGIYAAIALSKRMSVKKLSLKNAWFKHKSSSSNILKALTILFTVCWMFLLYTPMMYEYVNTFYVVTDVLSVICGVVSAASLCIIIDSVTVKKA